MKAINILVIEDRPEESKLLIQMLKSHQYNISGVARTLKEALTLFYHTNVDLVIIDIFLNGVPDGISFAETINTVPMASRPFVFLTSSADRQIFERAKLTQPFSFLIKPFNKLEVLYAIEIALEKFYKQESAFASEQVNTIIGKDYLFIKKGKSLKKVLLSDILYIEVEEKYCNIVTLEDKFVILISLKKTLEWLDSALFLQTHRKFIVNREKITEIVPSDNLIVLQGNHTALLGEHYKELVKQFRTLR